MKKHKVLKIVLGILCFLLFIGGSVGGYCYYSFFIRPKTEPKTTLTETNTDAAIHDTPQAQMRSLFFYRELYNYLKYDVENIEENLFAIPGMKATKTIGKTKGQTEMCTSMTPQGIAVSDKYMFISAYCHTHEHHSVIYVIEKDTHNYIKEIVLPGRPHVGGMAYDTENDNLWVSCTDNSVAAVAAIHIDAIEEYDLERDKTPISYLYKYPIYTITKSSFITYNNRKLYIGYFSAKGESTMQSFQLDAQGAIMQVKDESYASFAKTDVIAKVVNVAEISQHVQGMALSGNRLMLTQSYGVLNSTLTVFKNSEDSTNFLDTQAINKVITPRQLEQIYIDGGDLYMIFESGSYAYSGLPLPAMDYVVRINLYKTLKIDKKDLENIVEELPKEEADELLNSDETSDDNTSDFQENSDTSVEGSSSAQDGIQSETDNNPLDGSGTSDVENQTEGNEGDSINKTTDFEEVAPTS